MSASTPSIKTTVGVLSVDDPVFPYCRYALDNQVGAPPFHIEIVSRVSPFSAAFDQLVSRTTTDFMIQVDEDMILYPYAVARMQEVMEVAPQTIGMVLFYLYDPDRDQRIHGIKVFRTSVLRNLKSKDVKASEMDLLEQMLEAGYGWVIHPETMGYHGILYSPDSIYRRYKSMYEKDISTWNVVTPDMRRKAEAYAASGDPNQLFALLGAAHGITGAQSVEDREKDFRTYEASYLGIFRHLLLTTPTQGVAYDPGRPATAFRNEPIPFESVAWVDSRALLSASEAALSRQDRMEPSAAIAFDVRIVECMSREWLLTQARSNPQDAFLFLWVGVAHWYHHAFSEAWQSLESARALGAPEWRVCWFEALCLRDNRLAWTSQSRSQCGALVRQVLQKHPDFDCAKHFLSYLEAGSSKEALIADFFSCNKARFGRRIEIAIGEEARLVLRREQPGGIDMLGLSVFTGTDLRTLSEIDLSERDPQLVVIHRDRTVDVELCEVLFSKGYVLWFKDEANCYFRSFKSLPAPLFWALPCALPVRFFTVKERGVFRASCAVQESTAIVTSSMPEACLREVQQLLTQGRVLEAYELLSRAALAMPDCKELQAAERALQPLIGAAT